MTPSHIVATDRAIATLVGLALEHPEVFRAAGERVWSEIQRRQGEQQEQRRASREKLLQLLETARRAALGEEYEVPEGLFDDPRWADYFGMMKRRQEDRGDLASVDASEVLLDAWIAAIPEDLSSLGSPPPTREEAIEDLRGRLDPKVHDRAPLGPCWEVAQLIAEELRELDATRTIEEWEQIAVLALIAEAPDVMSTSLGFGVELPVGRNKPSEETFECRDIIRQLVVFHQPSDEVPMSYGELIQRTAIKLESQFVRPPVASGAATDPASRPRRRRRSDSPAPDGWFWLARGAEEYPEFNQKTIESWVAGFTTKDRVKDEDLGLVRIRRSAFERIAKKRSPR